MKTKRIFMLLVLIVSYRELKAQGLYNANWYFGWHYGLNFVGGAPIPISNNSMPAVEAASSISDSFGNLLFYTNAQRIWNRQNQIMPNGDTLHSDTGPAQQQQADSFGSSTTNGVVIMPAPGSNNRYYVFNVWGNCWCGNPNLDAIGYSVVDMNLEGGFGDVVQGQKNIPLQPYKVYTEKLTAVKHGNGRDWWVIAHDTSNNFIEWLITPDSIVGPFIHSVGNPHSFQPAQVPGEISVSKDGSKIGLVTWTCGIVETFNFDRCSGAISTLCDFSVLNCNGPNYISRYGCSFSPDGNLFYFSGTDSLWQVNINESEIAPCGIPQLIAVAPFDSLPEHSNTVIGQHELAPDGKIYINYAGQAAQFNDTASKNADLYVINNPNVQGIGCNFSKYNGSFGGENIIIPFCLQWETSLPNMPNYNLRRLEGSACDTLYNNVNSELAIVKSIVRVYPNPSSEELNVEVLNGVKPKQVTVTDALGRDLIKLTTTKPNTQLNIKQLSAGVYFVRVQMQNGEVQIRKFVKE